MPASTLSTLSAKSYGLGLARRIWICLFALVTIVFMAYVIREHHTALAEIHLTSPWLLIFAAAMHGVFWLVAIAFWRYAVRVTTQKKLSMRESFRQLALVAVGKYIPGKVWGFLARGTALKQSEASTAEVFAATFVEQWAMLMSAGLVGGLLLLMIRPNGLLTVVGVAAIVTSVLGNHLFRFGVSMFQRALSAVSESNERRQIIPLRYPHYLILLLTHSLMWVLMGSVLASIYFAFSLQAFSIELYAALVLANTVGIVTGFVALFAPGGLGVREAVTTAVLLPYIPLEQAALLSITFRLWTTLIDIFLAVTLVWQAARATRRTHMTGFDQ